MKIFSAYELQKRIVKTASEMDCENNRLAKQGKASSEINEAIFEMMFLYPFLPYWPVEVLRQKECYLNDKYQV